MGRPAGGEGRAGGRGGQKEAAARLCGQALVSDHAAEAVAIAERHGGNAFRGQRHAAVLRAGPWGHIETGRPFEDRYDGGPVSRLTPITSAAASSGTGGYTPALRAGDFVYVSGQGPLDPGTLEVLGESVAEQTTHTLRNVLELVRAAGGDAESIVRCTCYLHSIDSFDE